MRGAFCSLCPGIYGLEAFERKTSVRRETLSSVLKSLHHIDDVIGALEPLLQAQ